MDMIKKTLITAMSFVMVGCAGMKIPDYADVKTSPYYTECRDFAADVYKNNGYSKLAALLIKSKVGWSLPHPPGGLS